MSSGENVSLQEPADKWKVEGEGGGVIKTDFPARSRLIASRTRDHSVR